MSSMAMPCSASSGSEGVAGWSSELRVCDGEVWVGMGCLEGGKCGLLCVLFGSDASAANNLGSEALRIA